MKIYKVQRHTSAMGFAVFVVISLLLFMSLMLVAFGTGAYNRIMAQGRENSRMRIFTNYVPRKLREADSAENVYIETGETGTVLVIHRVHDAQTYLTRIYCMNGCLMEMITEEDAVFHPELGEKIWNAQAFCVSRENETFLITITAQDGQTYTGYAAMHTK